MKSPYNSSGNYKRDSSRLRCAGPTPKFDKDPPSRDGSRHLPVTGAIKVMGEREKKKEKTWVFFFS